MWRTKSALTAAAPSFASNAPNDFYQQHHTVDPPAVNEREFRPAWRVKTKLMLLLECERIDRRQLEAGLMFRGWVEAIGKQRGSVWLAVPRVDGGRQPEASVTAHQLDGAHRLRDAALALGGERVKLLVWALVDDLPWTEIGKRLRLSTKTATCRAVEAIAALSLWRAGFPVPPPPVNKPRIEPRRW